MTTKAKKTDNLPATTSDATTTLPAFKATPEGVENTLDLLDEKETGEMIEASSDYLEFIEGVPVAAIAYGIQEIANQYDKTGTNPTTEAVQMYAKDETGKARAFINADAVFVSTCKRLLQKANERGEDAIRVKVINRGERKGKNGNYKDLAIYTI